MRLAEAVGMPLDTLKDWLDAPAPVPAPKVTVEDDAADARIASIVEGWRRWEGPFSVFCVFVRAELRIPYGDTLIGGILAERAGRRPKRRPGRRPGL